MTFLENSYKDCYVKFDGENLVIGNEKICREIRFQGNIPLSQNLYTPTQNWSGGDIAMFHIGSVDFANATLTPNAYVQSFGGNSEEALCFEMEYSLADASIRQILYCFPGVAAISSALYVKGSLGKADTAQSAQYAGVETHTENGKSAVIFPEYGITDCIALGENHIKLTAVRLMDETDKNNELVAEAEYLLYGRSDEYYNGNIFILDAYTQGKAILVVSENYSGGQKFSMPKDFVAAKDYIGIFGDAPETSADTYTYVGGATYVLADKSELTHTYKSFYKKLCRSEEAFIMSNTWGDRNQDGAVCEAFILKEIDIAAALGVDIVQIDDGWQKGLTANSRFTKNGPWGDFYAADQNFWSVNPERFPNGLAPVKQHADAKGIKLGLWFSMDKGNDYASWKTDAEKLLELHADYGITYFKIDGLQIVNPTCEQNIKNFLDMLYTASQGAIHINLDITAHRRLGYFLHKQYSTLFVENRYTDFTSYYPFRTLRNVWSLLKYFPAQKFQFELLNEKRNADKYGEDILRPSLYDIDYLFASVMVANPLVWMEMSGLDEAQKQKLGRIIGIYKKERCNFTDAKITPIGDRPDGLSHTGFHIENECGGYLILLGENSAAQAYTYEIGTAIKSFEVLAANTDNAKVHADDTKICVEAMDMRSYLFIKYTK